MKFIPESKIILFFLAFLIFQPVAINADPVNYNNAIFKKGDCGLTVEDPHISISMLKKGEKVIKANVASVCIYAQDKVKFEIELLKKGAFGWKLVKKFSREILKPTPSPFKVEVKNAYVECKSNKRTIYLARASAKTTIAGKVYISPLVYSNETGRITCGT